MSEHPNLLKSVLIFTNPKGQHNSSLAYQKMDEVQHQTSIYVAAEDIPAGTEITDPRWVIKLDNSAAYAAERAREEAEALRVEAEAARMGFVPKGDYDAETEYKHGDWVSANGGSYGYIYPTPSTGVPVTDTSHWQQIASIGGQDLVDAAVAARDAAKGYKDDAAAYAAQLAAGTASPAGTYANLAALIAADPDHSKIYLTLDDGNWCYHNGTAWVAGGVYQTLQGVDATLSKTGYAADAKVTGDKVGELKSALGDNSDINDSGRIVTPLINGIYETSTGAFSPTSASYKATRKMYIKNATRINFLTTLTGTKFVLFWKESGEYISFTSINEGYNEAYVPANAAYFAVDVSNSNSGSIEFYITPYISQKLEIAQMSVDVESDNAYKGTTDIKVVPGLYDTSNGKYFAISASYKTTEKTYVRNKTSIEILTAITGQKYIVFWNKNNEHLSSTALNQSTNKAVVPSNAQYFAIDIGNGNNITSISVKIDPNVHDDLSNVAEIMRGNYAPYIKQLFPVRNAGYYLQKNTGNVNETASIFSVTDSIDVAPGENYIVTLIQQYNNGVIAFYDDQDDLVSIINADDGVAGENDYYYFTDYTFVVPANATYMKIGSMTKFSFFLGKRQGYKLLSGYEYLGKKWVCVGDSLTSGRTAATEYYYDYISDETGIEIVNMGYSGSGYKKLDGENHAFYQRILDVPTDADVITIFGSFNDLGISDVEMGDADDTGTTTIAGCINTTLDNLFTVYPLANVGIVTPTPWVNANPLTPSGRSSQYVELLKTICDRRSIPCFDLFHCSGLRPWDASYRALVYDKDSAGGVHPNEIGHKIIAARFKAFLSELLL